MLTGSISELLSFILSFISFPVYVVFLITVIKFRTKKPFNTSFFAISFSHGVADLFMLIQSYMVYKFPRWDWFYLRKLYLAHPTGWLPKYCVVGVWLFGNVQMFGIIILALNRFCALVFPLRNSQLWNNTTTRIAIGFQWLFSAILVSPLLTTSFSFHYHNETDQIFLNFDDYRYRNAFFGIFALIHVLFSNAVMGCLYTVMFYKAWKANNKVSPATATGRQQVGTIKVHRQEIKLAISGFVMFLTVIVYATFMALSALNPAGKDKNKENHYMKMWYVVGDVFSYENPWLLLATSEDLRKHFMAVITCRSKTMSKAKSRFAKGHGHRNLPKQAKTNL